jgi:hypothetical protein
MSVQDLLIQQVVAFQSAIIDSCRRSRRPDQTDAMALRLRGSVVSMTRQQLALLALAGLPAAEGQQQSTAEAQQSTPEGHLQPMPETLPQLAPEPPEPEPPPSQPLLAQSEPEWAADTDDHVLSGDALARFVSRRIDPRESPYSAWQRSLQESEGATQRYPAQASDRRRRDVNARTNSITKPP